MTLTVQKQKTCTTMNLRNESNTYFKEAKKGVEIMCRTIEVMRNESEIQGAIKAYKNLKLKDEEIVEFLLSSYDFLSEAEAEKLVEEFNKD